jgi:CHASE3 domain sensor protein
MTGLLCFKILATLIFLISSFDFRWKIELNHPPKAAFSPARWKNLNDLPKNRGFHCYEGSMTFQNIFQMNKGTLIGFATTFLLILLTLGIALWGLHRTVGNFESVSYAKEVSEQLLRVLVDLKDAEDQQREYLLTEKKRFLEPYQQAVESTLRRLAELDTLSFTHQRLKHEWPTLKPLILHRLRAVERVLGIQKIGGSQAAIEFILSGEGMQLMAAIQHRILTFDKKTAVYLRNLQESAYEMEGFTIRAIVLGIVLTFLIAMFALWKFMRDLTERQKIERRLLEEAKLAEVSRRISDIGHDIKNMLTPIQMGMNLLEDELHDHFHHPDRNGEQFKAIREFSQDMITMTRRGAARIQERVKEIADAVKGLFVPLTLPLANWRKS